MTASYDIDLIREKFPALSQETNGKPWVFLDNPGGTQVPQQVIDAISKCLVESNANLGGPFITSQRANIVVEEAHQAMADFVNARSASEIIFGQNSTSLTFHMSRTLGQLFKPGDEIILTQMEHDANVTPWELMARDQGLEIKWLPVNTTTFEFDLELLEPLIGERTRLLCVNHASNMTGTINDVKMATEIAHRHGVMVYVDSVQYAAHGAVDVQDLGCDFLMCSPYKFFGPHVGVLWAKEEILSTLEPYKVRAASNKLPNCFETGTLSHESLAGVSAAVAYFDWIGSELAGERHRQRWSGLEGHRRQSIHAAFDYLFEYEDTLMRYFITQLRDIAEVTIIGISDLSALQRRVPTISFTVDGKDPEYIAQGLARENIFVWHGHNYAIELSQALNILDKGSVVRVGFAHYNTLAEAKLTFEVLKEIIFS